MPEKGRAEALRPAGRASTAFESAFFLESSQEVVADGVLGRVLGLPEGGDVELTCLRSQLPEELQQALDLRLLSAVAAGDHAQVAQALAEGGREALRAPSALAVARALQDQEAEQLLVAAGHTEAAAEVYGGMRQALAARSLPGAVGCLQRGCAPWPGAVPCVAVRT